ncbi:prepilin-type N-terminal cleavage/methylation domain-containing protein [Comamonadaceae bacterium]|nr:prepilin-type N-terminal cleavage/methylation domain-containing protein [Comamonadaceae bacterium]
MKRQSSKQSGFTLVEIAIVLVIIGLLLGGVLKGQELMTSSKAKALDNDKAGLMAAFASYSDRYKSLAGDDILVATRFTVDQCGGAACVPGDGGGTLNGSGYNAWSATLLVAPAATAASEQLKVFQHLRAGGFLKAGEQHPTVPALSGFSNPRNAAGTRIGVQANGHIGQIQASQAQAFIWLENVPANVAQALDSSVDDGFVNLGTYRGVQNGVAAAANVNTGASYALGTTATGAPNATPANVAIFNLAAPLF